MKSSVVLTTSSLSLKVDSTYEYFENHSNNIGVDLPEKKKKNKN